MRSHVHVVEVSFPALRQMGDERHCSNRRYNSDGEHHQRQLEPAGKAFCAVLGTFKE
jgi:hypothetical protein